MFFRFFFFALDATSFAAPDDRLCNKQKTTAVDLATSRIWSAASTRVAPCYEGAAAVMRGEPEAGATGASLCCLKVTGTLQRCCDDMLRRARGWHGGCVLRRPRRCCDGSPTASMMLQRHALTAAVCFDGCGDATTTTWLLQ